MNWIAKMREKYGFHTVWTLRILLPLSVLVCAIIQVPTIFLAFTSESYVSVPGRIVDVQAHTDEGYDNFITTISVLYEYQLNGETYKTDAYSYFGPFQLSHASPWEKEIALQE